jgi:branched-chain amino acid transport system substrate-binding protein
MARYRLRVLPLILAVLLAACGGSGTSTTTTKGTVKVGLDFAQSGVLAVNDAVTITALKLAAKKLNDAGGFTIGNTQYTISLDIAPDNQSQNQQAIANTQQLVRDDGVKFIFGPTSSPSLAAAAITDPAKVMMFSSSSALAPKAGTDQGKYIFLTLPSLANRAKAVVSAIQGFVPNAKTVALFSPNDANTAGIGPTLKTAVTSAGLTFKSFTYPSGSTDLSQALAQLNAANVDVVILGFSTQDRVTPMKQMDAAGVSKSLTILDYAAAAEEGTYAGGRPFIAYPLGSVDLTDTSNADVAKFDAEYVKFAGIPSMTSVSWQGIVWFYDFLGMLVEAMKSAKSVTDTDAISAALLNVSYKGLGGRVFSYDPQHAVKVGATFTFVDSSGKKSSKYFE